MKTKYQCDFSESPVLKTERLILRELVLFDAAGIFVFRSDPIGSTCNSDYKIENPAGIHSLPRRDTSWVYGLIPVYGLALVLSLALLWPARGLQMR